MPGRGNQEPVPAFPQIIAGPDEAPVNGVSGRLLEQLFGSRTMLAGAIHMGLDAADFELERRDASLELLDREGIEVLLAERNERIVGLAGEEVVKIHG